jgi:ribokinase
MAQIVVLGGLNMDLVVRIAAIPRPGETLSGGKFATFPGGKGANQAVAAARMGAQVAMVGRVGSDAFGEQMLASLAADGIETATVGIDPDNATGVALITVAANGQNSISVASGANLTVTVEDVRSAFKRLGRVDLLVMPLETPFETILEAARLARQAGAQVILNPAPAAEMPAELLNCASVLAPNETETEFLTGVTVSDDLSARQAAQALLQRGPHNVVLTLGERGALLATGRPEAPDFLRIPSYAVDAIDTTAAGDAFVGALAAGIGEGLALPAAVSLANAAAAISVTRLGAQPSLARRSEVNEFLKSGVQK